MIQFCLKPDANKRATTKDILRHEWLAHGPVVSIRSNQRASIGLPETSTNLFSSNHSLADLELNTSSFYDNTRLRDNNSSIPKDPPTLRHRVSAIPIATRYLNPKNGNSIARRPVSLSLDDPSPTTSLTNSRPIPPSSASNKYVNDERKMSNEKSRYMSATSSDSTYLFPTENKSDHESMGPSVFTTTAIKFAPVPLRRRSSPASETTSYSNNSISNVNDALQSITEHHQRSSLTSADQTSSITTNLAKQNLLDDNNNFISLRIYD